MITRKDAKDIAVGVGFLLPNILGFLAFTAIPLVISMCMAFTNWNLELHNYFKNEPVQWVGFDNFVKLLNERDFYRFLGNTLFMMIGIPFGMAGSLIAALLLNQDYSGGGNRRVWGMAIAGSVLVMSAVMLTLVGMGSSAMILLLMGVFGVAWIGGSVGGATVYRTLFYFPYFTAGVATYILWKKLYSPENGPINNVLQPLLDSWAPFFASFSSGTAAWAGLLLLAAGVAAFGIMTWRNLWKWREGEAGTGTVLLAMALLVVPLMMAGSWTSFDWAVTGMRIVAGLGLAAMVATFLVGRDHPCKTDYGLSGVVICNGALMCVLFAVLGVTGVVANLPAMAADGLDAPKWVADYNWAKPAIIFMGLWAAFGSNNMLLYLAGLSGVSQELYEAADIDGASRWQRFWNVTWPQLANVTFFIFVMSVIGGLQGGFEMARTMTNGGPAGSTTTLSYYIYTEGFSTGRLGYASAVAWTLFLLVLSVTIFNWKFGNRNTND